MTVKKTFSVMSGKSLRSKLRNSKPYAGLKAFDSSAQSVLTSQRATPWSEFTIGLNASGFSLPSSGLDLDTKRISEVEKIRRISLPIDGMTFYNDWRYPERNISSMFPAGDLCILLSIFRLKPKIPRSGTNECRDLQTSYHYTKISPLIARELSQELSRHLDKHRTLPSFLEANLWSGVFRGDSNLVELLLSWSAQKRFGLDIVNGLVVAFKDAIRKRNRDVELFLEWGAHIEVLQTELDYGIFELVLESPVLEIIKLFRIYGFDPEKGYGNPPRTPLQAAVMRRPNDPVGVARCLLDLGVDIEGCCKEEPQTPLQLAMNNGNYEVIKLHLTRGANTKKGTATHHAHHYRQR